MLAVLGPDEEINLMHKLSAEYTKLEMYVFDDTGQTLCIHFF